MMVSLSTLTASVLAVTMVTVVLAQPMHHQNFAVLENMPINTVLGKLQCASSSATYTINEPAFAVENSGLLVTARILDREVKEMYEFVVNVSVGNQVICNVMVHIMVSDVNDNAPVFSSKTFHMMLPTPSSKGTIIGQVQAMDADVGENAVLTYSLQTQTSAFTIGALTGAVFIGDVAQLPTTNMELVVKVSDAGEPPLSSYSTIHIMP